MIKGKKEKTFFCRNCGNLFQGSEKEDHQKKCSPLEIPPSQNSDARVDWLEDLLPVRVLRDLPSKKI